MMIKSDIQHLNTIKGRLHVGAFGFDGVEHVLQPLRLLKADAFFLLEGADDSARKEYANQDIDIDNELDQLKIPWTTLHTDLWDPIAIGSVLRHMFSRFGFNELSVNVSTGPNTVAVGATLASMFWNVHLYHPKRKEPSRPPNGPDDLNWLQTLKAPEPNPRDILALRALDELGGSALGGKLKAWVRENDDGSFTSEKLGKYPSQALHNRMSITLGRLQELGLISKSSSGKSLRIKLTSHGQQFMRLITEDPPKEIELLAIHT